MLITLKKEIKFNYIINAYQVIKYDYYNNISQICYYDLLRQKKEEKYYFNNKQVSKLSNYEIWIKTWMKNMPSEITF